MEELAPAVAWWLDHPFRLAIYILTLHALLKVLEPIIEALMKTWWEEK